MPSVAPTGQRNRQYKFRTTAVATSSSAEADPTYAVLPNKPNIQNGSA